MDKAFEGLPEVARRIQLGQRAIVILDTLLAEVMQYGDINNMSSVAIADNLSNTLLSWKKNKDALL